MSDRELDNLFREAADGFKIQEDQAAWEAMSARLDDAGRVPSFWSWKTISGLALIGLTGIAVIWYNFDSGIVDQTQVGAVQSVENESGSQSQGSESTDTSPIPALPSERLAKPSDSQTLLKQELNETAESHSISDVLISTGVSSRVFQVEPSNDIANSKMTLNFSEQEQNQNSGMQSDSATELSKFGNEDLLSGSSNNEEMHLSDSIQSDSAIASALLPVFNETATGNVVTQKKSDNRRSISLKLSVSPDFSSIEYFNPDKSGINAGVIIGYNFNNRWSVVSGAISSRKIYSSTEIDKPYTTSNGYDYAVVELDGDCRVIDIPLNVYYTFYQRSSLSFKAGLGLSSYLMTSEDYTYYIDNPYGSDVYTARIERENNEWFKVANISVVVQKKLNNHFYLELEPFMKAPLAGIGEGKVSLVTLGVFINLRYDINL